MNLKTATLAIALTLGLAACQQESPLTDLSSLVDLAVCAEEGSYEAIIPVNSGKLFVLCDLITGE